MNELDTAFFKRRIREELTKAGKATDAGIQRLHMQWAKLYEDRLQGVPTGKLQMQRWRRTSF